VNFQILTINLACEGPRPITLLQMYCWLLQLNKLWLAYLSLSCVKFENTYCSILEYTVTCNTFLLAWENTTYKHTHIYTHRSIRLSYPDVIIENIWWHVSSLLLLKGVIRFMSCFHLSCTIIQWHVTNVTRMARDGHTFWLLCSGAKEGCVPRFWPRPFSSPPWNK